MVGSNNSAHDICAALWENDVDVTMVQRSSTHIVRSDTLMDVGLGALYSEEAVRSGVTTEKADLIFASLPYRILHEFQIPAYAEMKKRDADFYEGLEKAGFWLDWGDDESGLFLKYLRRGSGYYIDIGASQLIIDGEIKLIDTLNFEKPSTRQFSDLLQALEIDRSCLLAIETTTGNEALSARNLKSVSLTHIDRLNAFDVLNHRYLLAPKMAFQDYLNRVSAHAKTRREVGNG